MSDEMILSKKTFCFDIDNTIVKFENHRDYENFKPDKEMVRIINDLYDDGHTIVLYTARGMKSVGAENIVKEILPPLIKNLENIGLKYHELLTHKPVYDWIIDDKAIDPFKFKLMYHSETLETAKPYEPKL